MFLQCTECALNHGSFIRRYLSDPAMYSTIRATKIQPDSLFSIYKIFKLLFHYYIVLELGLFFMGKVQTVCIRCVPTLHRMRVESWVFYSTISQRSCNVQHSTWNQNVAIHSMFNIQGLYRNDPAWYSTLPPTKM